MITSRSYKSYDREKYLSDLAVVPFHVPFIFDDVDDQVWAFERLFNEIVDDHAPRKCFRIRGGQVPYMTPQWRRNIRLRNRLWKKYLKQRTESSWLDYKKQRNVCTSLWRKAIAGYFHDKANVSEAKPQEFWKLFAPIFKSKYTGHTNDINLIEDNTFVSNKCDIADIFNNFFCEYCLSSS